MADRIAIVGMACRYPDADGPAALWENVLAQRRAFRKLPPERLRAADYYSDDRAAPDRTYVMNAAVIEGYEFDRVAYRVAGSIYRSADLAHWLSLDTASRALADAGFPGGEDLPRRSTGVHLGNTLTGEFSRANVMRLRWPYVRRVVEARLREEGWEADRRRVFLADLEALYKKPFPPVGNETLSGGLSNTIAGRICNYFDLKGGGYTVDGACAASLLAVISSCNALAARDLDVAVAGGVDLSLDPFELVGFAKTGALAPEDMRLYDTRSAGFWPGEGCGFVVLMRQADALAQSRRIYAVLEGWGISSDGSGGITRPDVEGQMLALERAYRRAGFGIGAVAYHEGHGTGTRVGDATELEVLTRVRREADPGGAPAAIGSIKANIGHTKAAAGVAGLIKATMAVHERVLPPTTGCGQPHPILVEGAPALRVLAEAEPWPEGGPARASVSAMGFGGINTHVALGEPDAAPRVRRPARLLTGSAQDAELILLGAPDAAALRERVRRLLEYADRLSLSEVTDLAATMARRLERRAVRAAVVAARPAELAARLRVLHDWLEGGVRARLDADAGALLGSGDDPPRIAFVFPGQGSPVHRGGGAMGRRFALTRPLYERLDLPADVEDTSTTIAQPAIVTGSMAALRVLRRLGVEAAVAAGHSLGELTALHWAGAFDEEALLRIATARGRAMAELGSPTGAMASIGAARETVAALIEPEPSLVIAGLNAPRQTVVSGQAAAVDAVIQRARAKGIRAVRLPVSHAFHSALVEAAVPSLRDHLGREPLNALERAVASTVTGGMLEDGVDVGALLCRQVVSPVRFTEAAALLLERADLVIEVGPGSVMCGLLAENAAAGASGGPALVSVDAGGRSLRGLLTAVGAAFALGAPVDHGALFEGRFGRSFDLDWRPRFFVNPCELAPVSDDDAAGAAASAVGAIDALLEPAEAGADGGAPAAVESPLELLRRLVADHAELPVEAVKDDDRFLSDLHLNSLTVGQLVAEAARRLGLAAPAAPTDYADATIARVVEAFEHLAGANGGAAEPGQPRRVPAGVDTWVRAFTIDLVERPRPVAASGENGSGRSSPGTEVGGAWHVLAPAGGAAEAFAERLREALDQDVGGAGVAVVLPSGADAGAVDLLLEGARRAEDRRPESRFLLVHEGGAGAALARTLHVEAPHVATCVVEAPLSHPDAIGWIVADVGATRGYSETSYDVDGTRRQPVARHLRIPDEVGPLPLGPEDVLLVTGGGKGIAAECALALGERTGASIIVLGRSDPAGDRALADNLARLEARGVRFRYARADVTDAPRVAAALAEAQRDLGPVTALLHGAGLNVPKLLAALSAEDVAETAAPKVRGAENVLAALDPARLRLFVSFGSIIARTGLQGEADYALANAWLADLTRAWGETHPHCRCQTVEWSIWSGVGMGQRLGRVDVLAQRGISAITPEEGVRFLLRLLGTPVAPSSIVVSGRFGEPPTLALDRRELPLRRFLERPVVNYPGVELVVDAEISGERDPYLDDHVFRRQRLLPAVLGLEAMAQAAAVVAGAEGRPVFESVEFNRPVIVPEGSSVMIRVAALERGPDAVEVVLRSDETGFQLDHFRAICRFGAVEPEPEPQAAARSDDLTADVGLDPARDLYGGILFQSGRFRRLRRYRKLRAVECVAVIEPERGERAGCEGGAGRGRSGGGWFSGFLPGDLLLGDPAVRDAALHAIQACIPHRTLLPVGADRIVPGCGPVRGNLLARARERSRDGDVFTYDLVVTDADGAVRERWDGLRLKAVDATATPAVWPVPLLGPYLERRLQELLPGAEITVAALAGAGRSRRERSDAAIEEALGRRACPRQRPDGKPEATGGCDVSASHAGSVTIGISGPGPVGCDAEPVAPRTETVWRDLLGAERFALADLIAAEAGEERDAAATRVWTATESLKKAGVMPDAPLVLDSCGRDGWVRLASGRAAIATVIAGVAGLDAPLAIGILTTRPARG